ncbi:MAG: GtrA family protein [Blautia sp.]|nr:GtrA family protein [Blautia sp.]
MKKLILKLYGNDVIRYIFFGVCTTLVNLVSFYLLRKAGIGLNIANVISIIIAICFAYIVNSKYVFRNHVDSLGGHIAPFVKFVSARILSMGVEVGGVWLIVEKLGQPDMAGKCATQVIVMAMNYVFSKFFVFINKEEGA